jgi:hypothetical protein
MYRMICVALQLFYHSIRGTRVRLGPYVFSMRQAFPIQAALAQRKSNPVRYGSISVALRLASVPAYAHPRFVRSMSGVNYFFALTTIISPGQRQLPLNS